MRSLYRGIDKLDLRVGTKGQIEPSEKAIAIFDQADRVQKTPYGMEADDITMLPGFPEIPFQILRRGKHPYRYVFSNPNVCDVMVWNVEGWNNGAARGTGQIFVNWRSKFLLENGWEECVRLSETLGAGLLSVETDSIWTRISEIHLCSDTECEEPLNRDDFAKFKTRARLKTEHISVKSLPSESKNPESTPQLDNKGGAKPDDWLSVCPDGLVSRHLNQPDTVRFGAGANPIHACIYNKTEEAKRPDKRHWFDVWEANGKREGTLVYRTEFRMRGDFLKELSAGANEDWLDPRYACSHAEELWTYCATKWLVQVEKAANGKREAAVLTEFWDVVANSYETAPPPRRFRLPRPDMRELLSQAKGCMLTLFAMLGGRGGYGAALEFYDVFGDWLMSNCFLQEFDARCDRLLMSYTNSQSETQLSIRKSYMYQQLVPV